MKAEEFEDAVREMRRRQKRYFACRKDSPDKDNSKRLMREQEGVVGDVIKTVIAVRPKQCTNPGIREIFFLKVAKMMDLQREWMKYGGGTNWVYSAVREAEKEVDAMLANWENQRKVEQEKKTDEERKRQLKLF